MRHLKKSRKFNKDAEHRRAMFNNMMISFFQHERIKTTSAKAKELRRLSEKIITRARENTLHNKRIVLKRLKNRDIIAKLFDEIAPLYKNVHGGYTRILKLGRRAGDGANMSLLELVDVEEKAEKKEKEKTAYEKPKTDKPKAVKTVKSETKKPKAGAKKDNQEKSGKVKPEP